MSTLIRRSPSAPFPALVDDRFASLMRRMFNDPLFAGTDLPSPWAPAVEVSETNDALTLTAELPGIEEKHVKLSIENNVLTLAGEKEQETTDGPPTSAYYMRERYYGAFQRSFTLPRTVDVEHIKATFAKGILTITLPKLPQAKGKVITIEPRT